MNSRCNEARNRLTDGGDAALPRRLAEHVEDCPACARYAARIQATRRMFRDHHGGVEPDAAFASRVVDRLRSDPNDALGWAAVRLLPVTVALLLILAWASFRIAPDSRSLVVQSPTDDLVSWAIDLDEEGS